MTPSRSTTVPIRGVDNHLRSWGDDGAPLLVLLHGAQDVSASWQFVVDALEHPWHVVAPDWRGHGLSGRSGADTYWFPDYVADLDLEALLRARTRPILFTCRTESEGGRFPDERRTERLKLLEDAARLGFDMLDVEARAGFDALVAAQNNMNAIV